MLQKVIAEHQQSEQVWKSCYSMLENYEHYDKSPRFGIRREGIRRKGNGREALGVKALGVGNRCRMMY